MISGLTDTKYINLETCRKNGERVRTPVWFIELAGKLYLRTDANSGKIKRIANNENIRVAPCDIRGNIKGDWIGGKARVESKNDVEYETINSLINKKYLFQHFFVKIMYKFRNIKVAIVSIELIQQTD